MEGDGELVNEGGNIPSSSGTEETTQGSDTSGVPQESKVELGAVDTRDTDNPATKVVSPPETPLETAGIPTSWESQVVDKMRRILGEIQASTEVIEANMIDLEGYSEKAQYGMHDGVALLQELEISLGHIQDRDNLQINDSLSIGNAQRLSISMLAEINRRRKERGEAPAESVFDPERVSSAEPIIASVGNADMVQLSKDAMEFEKDYPRRDSSDAFDTEKPILGRVNILKHEDMKYGQPNRLDNAIDAVRNTMTTRRHLYDNSGRYVGEWEQTVFYGKPDGRDDLPKVLGSYSEEVIDDKRKSVEKVDVTIGWYGVYEVGNTHFKDGQKSGATRLRFGYNNDGSIHEAVRTDYDASDTSIKEEDVSGSFVGVDKKEEDTPQSLVQEPTPPPTTATDAGIGEPREEVSAARVPGVVEVKTPEKQKGLGGVLGKISNIFGGKK